MSDEIVPKNFWKKPESFGGWVQLGLLGCGGFWIWKNVLPTLIALAVDTVIFGVLAGGTIATCLFLFANRAALTFLFKRSSYALTDAIFKIDPPKVMELRGRATKERANKQREIRKDLKKEISATRSLIQSNENERLRNEAGAKSSTAGAKFVMDRQAGRLKESNISLGQLVAKLEGSDRLLGALIERTDAIGTDMLNAAGNAQKNRVRMLSSHKILRASAKQLAGYEADMEEYNRGLQLSIEEYDQKMAELDGFETAMRDALSNMDMSSGYFNSDSMAVLEEWEKKSETFLLTAGDDGKLSSALNAMPPRLTEAASSSDSRYAHIFQNQKTK